MSDETLEAVAPEAWIPLLQKVHAAYGSDAYRQKGKAPVTNPRAKPLIEKAAAAGMLTIDRSEVPMMMASHHVTIAPEGYFVSLTEAAIDLLAATKAPTP